MRPLALGGKSSWQCVYTACNSLDYPLVEPCVCWVSMYLRPKAVKCYLQLGRTIEMTLVLVMELSEIEEASDDVS